MQMLGSKLKSGLADPENKAMLQRIFGGEEGEASINQMHIWITIEMMLMQRII